MGGQRECCWMDLWEQEPLPAWASYMVMFFLFACCCGGMMACCWCINKQEQEQNPNGAYHCQEGPPRGAPPDMPRPKGLNLTQDSEGNLVPIRDTRPSPV